MAIKMKLRRVGTSLGFTVPKEVLHDLDLEEGDSFYLVRTAAGIELTRYDPDFEEAMEVSRRVMRRYPNALKKLAEG